MHSLRPLSIVLSLSAFVAVACHAPARAQPELAGCHPACPGAVGAAIGDAGAGLRGAPAQPPPALEASPPAPSALAYLCPMHHHIGSDLSQLQGNGPPDSAGTAGNDSYFTCKVHLVPPCLLNWLTGQAADRFRITDVHGPGFPVYSLNQAGKHLTGAYLNESRNTVIDHIFN